MEIGDIIGDMSHRWFSLGLMDILVLGTVSNFYRGAKRQFLATFSTRFGIASLLFHNWEEYGKSKT